jgi:hypothetical protein
VGRRLVLMGLIVVAGWAWANSPTGASDTAWGELPVFALWLALGAWVSRILSAPGVSVAHRRRHSFDRDPGVCTAQTLTKRPSGPGIYAGWALGRADSLTMRCWSNLCQRNASYGR